MGNYADLAADEGHRLFGRLALKEYATVLAAKQRAYSKLMAAIHRRIARVQVAASKVRDDEAKEFKGTSAATIYPPAPPLQGSFFDAHGLYFQDYPIGGLADDEQRMHLMIRIFWTSLRFAPQPGREAGTSPGWSFSLCGKPAQVK